MKGAVTLPAKARRALRLRFDGGADQAGYVNEVSENLVPGVRLDQFEADLSAGSGTELAKKFRAVHSSSALAVNSFAWFKDRPEDLRLLGRQAPQSIAFERQLPIFRNRQPANLDVWLEFGDEVLAIESKLLEYLTPKRASFAPAYDQLAPPLAEEAWWAAFLDAKREGAQHLDRAQLLKHYFGLRRFQNTTDKALTLVYLFWEPSNWKDHPECLRHRSEVERFAAQVSGGSVGFRWTTYADVWRRWEALPAVREHVSHLRDRYEVTVPPTKIPNSLLDVYRATHFVCGAGPDAFVLRIGVSSRALADLCAAAGVSQAAYVTAFNPGSETQSADVNEPAHARLSAELATTWHRVVEGAGEDPDGRWPAEPSYLVLGIDLEAARELGRRYGQNAVVWAGADAVPTLVLLR